MSLIVSGELRPELVVRYAGNSRLLRRLSVLPRYDRDHIIADDRLIVADFLNRDIVFREARVAQLTAKEVDLVFRGRILSSTDQGVLPKKRMERSSRSGVKSLRKRFLNEAKVKSDRYNETESKSIRLRLTSWESQIVTQRVEKSGVKVSVLIIGALQNVGLFDLK